MPSPNSKAQFTNLLTYRISPGCIRNHDDALRHRSHDSERPYISSADSTTSSVSTSDSAAASGTATNAASIPTSFNPSPATTALASGLPSESSFELSSSAKIGLGVGIPAAALIGDGLGCLAFRRGKARGNQQSPGGPPQEDRPMGFAGYSAGTLKPASRIIKYVSPSNAPAYVPVSHAPVYRPVSSSPVYEASNEPPPPSELYTPENGHQ